MCLGFVWLLALRAAKLILGCPFAGGVLRQQKRSCNGGSWISSGIVEPAAFHRDSSIIIQPTCMLKHITFQNNHFRGPRSERIALLERISGRVRYGAALTFFLSIAPFIGAHLIPINHLTGFDNSCSSGVFDNHSCGFTGL